MHESKKIKIKKNDKKKKSSQSNAVVRTCHAEEGQSTLEGPFYVEEDPQGRRLQRWLKQIEKLNCHAEKRVTEMRQKIQTTQQLIDKQ